jgi:antirestriction protein
MNRKPVPASVKARVARKSVATKPAKQDVQAALLKAAAALRAASRPASAARPSVRPAQATRFAAAKRKAARGSDELEIFAASHSNPTGGRWLTVSDYYDAEELHAAIMEANGQNEEWAITDHNAHGLIRGENPSLESLIALAEAMEKHGKETIEMAVDEFGTLEDALENIDDIIVEEIESGDEDTAIGEAAVERFGGLDQLGNKTLMQYFDFAAYGRDIRLNGEATTRPSGRGFKVMFR